MPVTPKRRKGSPFRTVGLVMALAALLGLVLLVAPRSKTAPEPKPGRAEADNAPVAPGPAAPGMPPRPASSRRRMPLPDGGFAEAFDPHDTPIVPPALPSAFPYPPGSQPLTEGTDPATQPREDDVVDPKKGISVNFGPRVAVVHPDDPLRDRHGGPKPAGRPHPGGRRGRALPSRQQRHREGAMVLGADGRRRIGRDLAAGDLKYTATFLPTAEQKAAFLAAGVHVYLDVGFQPPGGEGPRKFSTVMEYSREPNASLNGRYTDALQQGSLVIEAGVTVKVAGQYRVIGSLYGAGQGDRLRAEQRVAGRGRHDDPAAVLRQDPARQGGRRAVRAALRDALRARADGDIPGETVDPAYTTQAYAAAGFSDAPYVKPAPTFEVVDMNSPSQQGKPGPVIKRGGEREPGEDDAVDRAGADQSRAEAESDGDEVEASGSLTLSLRLRPRVRPGTSPARLHDRTAVLGRLKDAFAALRRRCYAAVLRILDPACARRGRGAPLREAQGRRRGAMLRVYDVMIDVLRRLRPVLVQIERHDRDSGNQLRRAAASVALNMAEGSGSSGGTRTARYRTALGSAVETAACIDVAVALGYVAGEDREVKEGLRSVQAVLARVVG